MSDIATAPLEAAPKIMPGREHLSSEEATKTVVPQIQLPEEKVKEVVDWLTAEINTALGERSDLETKLAEWERLYEARPKVATKTFPWEGASNLVVPVIATAVDAVLARLLGSVFGGKKLFVGNARAANWVEVINPLENWLDWVSSEVMSLYKVCRSWFLSLSKYGTGILEVNWERRIKKVVYYDEGLGGVQEEYVVTHDGPIAENVPLIDFLFSNDLTSTQDVQNCSWVAIRKHYTWKNIKEKETSGIWYDVDKLGGGERTLATVVEEESQEVTGIKPMRYSDFEIWRVYCSYDVEGNGILSELVVDVHLEKAAALRAVYNYYRHQERPIHLVRYMPRDNTILGIGLCQMLADIQKEVTTIHNQRIDNATLANTKAWKRKRGTAIITTEIFPGCLVDVDEMDDIAELKIGDDHSSLLQEEMHTNAIGEKRSGVSDYSVGRESSAIGSRATATSTLAIIREGNKRFSMTIKDIREALVDVQHQIIMLYQQFVGEDDVMYEMFSEKEKVWVKKYFALPPEYSRSSVIIDIPALSEVDNKEMAQQTLLTLMGVVQKFYEGLFQAFGVAVNPKAPEELKQLATQGAKAGALIWERVLESFDFRDAEKFVPDVDTMLGVGSAAEMLGGNNGGQAGATGGPPEGQLNTPMAGPTSGVDVLAGV